MDSTAEETPRRSSPDHLRSAFVCGLVPLISGTSIILLLMLTHWTWLKCPGLFLSVVIVGIISSLFGIMHLGASVRDMLATQPGERRKQLFRILVVVSVLLSNFPATMFLMIFAQTHSRYVLTVTNAGPEALDKFNVYGGGEEIEFGSIGTAESEHLQFYVHELNVLRFNIRQDSRLTFRARRGGKEVRGTIVGYMTNGKGGDLQVTFNQDGSFDIRDNRNR
jgi:hypothetical protein